MKMTMNANLLTDRKLKILPALAILAVLCFCWTGRAQPTPATQSPQVQEIVKLTQAKMSDDVIISYIKNANTPYNLSADDILYLNGQGVSQPVISALLATKSSAAPQAPVATSAPVPPVPAQPQTPPAPQVVAPTSPAPQVSPYPGAAPVVDATAPPPGSEVNLAYFQAQLAPYGTWVNVPGEGLCWAPSVQNTVLDWRPYLNDGHWVYTDDGWSWQSDYPWGEYAFHYGRWFRDPHYGWMWRPGYHWGPGWVAWRNADAAGYCGWAPLPPGATFEPGVGLMWNGRVAVDTDFGLGPDMYVFVPYDHFWAHDYVAFRAPGFRVGFLFRGSLVANHWGFVGGRFVFDGIGRERIGILTHHEIRPEHIEFRDSHIAHEREIEHNYSHGRDFDHGGFSHDRDRHF
jgi:hypothetical protein